MVHNAHELAPRPPNGHDLDVHHEAWGGVNAKARAARAANNQAGPELRADATNELLSLCYAYLAETLDRRTPNP